MSSLCSCMVSSILSCRHADLPMSTRYVGPQLAPLVVGQELASAVIQDTVKYLGIQATDISNLNGPYLQVRPVRLLRG